MANKGDVFVQSGNVTEYTAQLAEPDKTIMRFADDNDGAQYTFGCFFRTCKTVEEANALVERSKLSRYMGRKRHTWYPAVTR